MNSDSSAVPPEQGASQSSFGWQLQEPSEEQIAQISERYATYADEVLGDAWRLYMALDDESGKQKSTWLRRRKTALNLSFLTLLLATLATWIAPILLIDHVPLQISGQVISVDFLSSTAAIVRLLLIVLPLTITGLVVYTSEFNAAPLWVNYRQNAEDLYRDIVLYRQRAGSYQRTGTNTLRSNQLRLASRIEATRQAMTDYQKGQPFVRLREDNEKTFSRLSTRYLNSSDDGVGMLSPEDYIATRIEPQLLWYQVVIDRSHSRRQNLRILTLTLTGASALAVAIGIEFGWLILIVSGLISYVNSLEALRGSDQFADSFAIAANNLDVLITSWRSLFDQERHAPHNVNMLIVRAEDLLSQERNAVFQQQMKTALVADNILSESIANLTGNRVTAETVRNFKSISASPTVTPADIAIVAAAITKPAGEDEAMPTDQDA